MSNIFFRAIFWCSLVFLAVCIWAVTFGQSVNYEFQNHKVAGEFYNIVFIGVPFVILLTLLGTLKKRHSTFKTILIIATTVGLSVISFTFLLSSLFSMGFGSWTTFNISYEYKSDPERQIRVQWYDSRALCHGMYRVVEVKPFAILFWQIIPIDTSKIDNTKWNRVDREGDVKFP